MATSSSKSTQKEHRFIDEAIEAFVSGLCFTRSFTHPFLVERFGPLWVMRDGPRRSGDNRTEEWIAYGVPPKEVDRIARKESRGRYAICAINSIDESDAPLRDGFKAIGYRLSCTEPFMTHRLDKIPKFDSPANIHRVLTQDLADELAKLARSRQILPEHFAPGAPLRQYVAMIDGKIVGWVRSIVAGKATWCASMFVNPSFRRRGIGRAMLCRMLKDDRDNGSNLAVLLASHTGALLYPVVGYEQIATLLLFTPKKR